VLAVLDACVLYPPSLRDLLLTLAALDAIDVRWSDEILEELIRNAVAKNPDIDRIRFEQHTVAAMRRRFPQALVTADPALAETLDKHPKDRHVAATAIAAGAAGIVTLNVKDFPNKDAGRPRCGDPAPGRPVDRLLDVVEVLGAHPSMTKPLRRLVHLLPPDTRWKRVHPRSGLLQPGGWAPSPSAHRRLLAVLAPLPV